MRASRAAVQETRPWISQQLCRRTVLRRNDRRRQGHPHRRRAGVHAAATACRSARTSRPGHRPHRVQPRAARQDAGPGDHAAPQRHPARGQHPRRHGGELEGDHLDRHQQGAHLLGGRHEGRHGQLHRDRQERVVQDDVGRRQRHVPVAVGRSHVRRRARARHGAAAEARPDPRGTGPHRRPQLGARGRDGADGHLDVDRRTIANAATYNVFVRAIVPLPGSDVTAIGRFSTATSTGAPPARPTRSRRRRRGSKARAATSGTSAPPALRSSKRRRASTRCC
jgi:hypothetical protein